MKRLVAVMALVIFVSASTVLAFTVDPNTKVGKKFEGGWPSRTAGFWPASVEVKNIKEKTIGLIYRQSGGERGEVEREIQTELKEDTNGFPKFEFEGTQTGTKFSGTFLDDGRLKMELIFGPRFIVEYFVVKQ